MREIKFRAWNSKKPDMVMLGDLTTGNWDIKFIFKHYVIMQYTSLKDKDGKDIYEGDILGLVHKKHGLSNAKVVVWNEGDACFDWEDANGDSWPDGFTGFYDEYEVIGNIYENPELFTKPEST